MAYSVNTLVEALRDEPESMWVRLVAHWLTDGDPVAAEPSSAGSDIGDALVAAAVAHRADTLGVPHPAWADDPLRRAVVPWHPAPDALYDWSLSQAPVEFRERGLIVDADSLISV